jgi:chloramphenicol 3-O phosphotransferase
MTAPSAIVLHGPSSAGKSSLAEALQAASPNPAFHISLDAFVTMTRRRTMSEAQDQAAYVLHCENLRATLNRVAATPFDIIVDLVLRDPGEFEACLIALGDRPAFLIGVQAPLAVLEDRERARPDRGEGAAREQIGDPAYRRRYDLVVDTSKCTPAEGAALIRQLVAKRLKTA